MTFDAKYATVTCSDCGRTYICSPLDDFYHRPEVAEDERGPDNGVCTDCLLRPHGLRVGAVAVLPKNEALGGGACPDPDAPPGHVCEPRPAEMDE